MDAMARYDECIGSDESLSRMFYYGIYWIVPVVRLDFGLLVTHLHTVVMIPIRATRLLVIPGFS